MAQTTTAHPSLLLSWLRRGPKLRSGVPVRVALLGLASGLSTACVISVNDGHSDGDGPEACFERYDDCFEEALPFGSDAIDACGATLDACLEASEQAEGETGGDPGDGGSDSGDPPGDSDSDSGHDSDGDSGDSDGDSGHGDGDGDGDEPGPDPACFELHAACVAEAMTIQDIEACEALFDNCIDPGPCESPECEEPGCPQDELDACVVEYAGCAAAAESEDEVLACEDMFDVCIAQFDASACLPNYDDELVDACLEQHGLCIACADDADEIAACQATFDNCLEA